MQQVQDRFFEKRYFNPAIAWADQRGFTSALAALVIYDSFIHSGQVLPFLQHRFAEKPPNQGGREQVWIADYVRVRHDWLGQHKRPAVRKSIYRTAAYLQQIADGNWDLARVPVLMNGTAVSPG